MASHASMASTRHSSSRLPLVASDTSQEAISSTVSQLQKVLKCIRRTLNLKFCVRKYGESMRTMVIEYFTNNIEAKGKTHARRASGESIPWSSVAALASLRAARISAESGLTAPALGAEILIPWSCSARALTSSIFDF